MLRIFFDGEKISGLAIGYYEGYVVQKVGKGYPDYMDYYLKENETFMGFFGASDFDYITVLGVVVQDTECTAEQERAYIRQKKQQEQESLLKEEEEEYNNALYVIFAIVLTGVVFLSIACIIKFGNKLIDVKV